MAKTSALARLLPLLFVVWLVGCAHHINVEPNLDRLGPPDAQRINARVGLHIPPELANLEVTTPGGGGDNVRYNPYAAVAQGYRRILSNVFTDIVPVASSASASAEASPTVDYVMVPSIVTNSGGTNFFTWPPESFTVDLSTSIRDKAGRTLASPRVVGTATVATGERLADHGIAGRRAFEDALQKMQVALRDWGRGLQAGPANAARPAASASARLEQLKDLLDRKLISEAEFETRRRAILADL